MKLIDKTYFQNLIAIPDMDEQWNDVFTLIKNSSEKILIESLGYMLFKELSDDFPTDSETDLYKLWFGADYEVNGITYNWKGFVNDRKLSMLAYASFYDWAAESWLLNSGSGTLVKQPEFWEVRNQKIRMAKVHNLMEDEIACMYNFIYYHIESFTDYGFSIVGTELQVPYTFKRLNQWGF